VIGSGVQIKGDIKAPSNVELCGTVEGSFEVDGHFVIRESGRLIGNVSANDIVVEGEVEGQVVAAQKVELGSTGRIQGDVQAKAVSIAEGAFFQGKVQMAGSGSGATSKKKEGVEKPAEAYAAQAAVGGRAPVGDPAFTKR
jgi:cytoskeletal protein CcmA (bactofilin family)